MMIYIKKKINVIEFIKIFLLLSSGPHMEGPGPPTDVPDPPTVAPSPPIADPRTSGSPTPPKETTGTPPLGWS